MKVGKNAYQNSSSHVFILCQIQPFFQSHLMINYYEINYNNCDGKKKDFFFSQNAQLKCRVSCSCFVRNRITKRFYAPCLSHGKLNRLAYFGNRRSERLVGQKRDSIEVYICCCLFFSLNFTFRYLFSTRRIAKSA